jgi:uncharacterized protein (DUF1697 family)
MALVVFLRGLNVGGSRRFRPARLALELEAFGVVNIGAAGTFVVHRPGVGFVDMLRNRLPFDAHIACCEAAELLALVADPPFPDDSPPPGLVRFVSILTSPARSTPHLPIAIPSEVECFVHVTGARGRFVYGEYRRHMRTIGYLGRIDGLFGVPATTRNWNTILAIARLLESTRASTD